MALTVVTATQRISDKPGFNVADLTLHTDERLGLWRATFGLEYTDRKLAGTGMMCGEAICGPQSQSLDLPADSDIVASFTYADTGGPPDGDYDIGCHGVAR